MAIDSWSDSSLATTDAQWRALLTKISDSLDLVGFDLATDTGQINLATATIPAAGAYGGFQIRYFNDSLHATKPVYTKMEFGRGSSNAANTVMIRVTVGSGTNGAGTISGTTYFAQLALPQQNNAGNTGLYNWYFSAEDGYVVIVAAKYMPGGQWFWSLCRTNDDSGTPNTEGVLMVLANNPSFQRRRYITSEVVDGSFVTCIPGLESSLAVGGDMQAVRHYALQPTSRCVPYFYTYIEADIGSMSTTTLTPSGARARTFLALGGVGASGFSRMPTACSANATTTHVLLVQYE